MEAIPDKIGLVRDVLDKLLVDRDEQPVGRVDGIVLVIESDDLQPRLDGIESGTRTLARRIGGRFARWLEYCVRFAGLRWKQPVRVDWSKVNSIGKELKLDICAENSPLTASERWLRDHIIRRIPGNDFKLNAEK